MAAAQFLFFPFTKITNKLLQFTNKRLSFRNAKTGQFTLIVPRLKATKTSKNLKKSTPRITAVRLNKSCRVLLVSLLQAFLMHHLINFYKTI